MPGVAAPSIPASTEASGTLTISCDVVTHAAIPTGAVLAAVDAILAERAGLGTNGTLRNNSQQVNNFNQIN